MVTYSHEAIFQALADGTRRDILALLGAREWPAGEVAERFPVSRPAISRHLRVLKEAGLVVQRKQAQTRFYRLNPEALRAVDHWLDHYRMFWSARLTDRKRYVEEQS